MAIAAAAVIASLGLTTFAVTPAQAETASTSSFEVGTSIKDIAVPPSDQGSKVIPIGAIPSSVTAATIEFKGWGAVRDTNLTASFDGNKTKTTVLWARANTSHLNTVTLPVPADNNGAITLVSSQAALNVNMKLISVDSGTAPAPAPTPAPAPSPAPAPTPAPTQAPAPAPTPSATPGDSNTGVPAGTTLTVHNGDLVVSTPGAVISGKDIRGNVKIQASNVTIKNSIIRGRSVTKTTPLINNLAGHSGLKVTDTELSPSYRSPYVMGFYGYNLTATRVDIHHVIDAIHVTGSNVTVQNSWLHDNLHYTSDPNHGGTPSHDDSIQVQKGNNIKITGNRITGAYNAALQITQDTGDVSNVTFSNNYANNGKCTVNIAQKANGPISGIVINDNKFGRDTRIDNCAIIASTETRSKISHARNYYVPDNTLVSIRNGG